MLREYISSDWQVSDKKWLNARKLQWKDLEKRMLCMNLCKRKDIPVLREFYLSGNMDWERFHLTHYRSSFYLMLLHPLQTYEQLKIIYDAIDDYSDMQQSLTCYQLAVSASIRGAQGDVFVELGNAGMFSGLDSIYARVFYGDHCQPPHKYDNKGELLYHSQPDRPEWAFKAYLGPALFFMLGITRYPYCRHQYMAEYAYSAIDYNTSPMAELKNLIPFMQCVCYFDELSVPDELAARRQLAEEWRCIFETRQLPAEMADLWQKIKSDEGRDFSRIIELKDGYLGTNLCPSAYIN